MSAVGLTSIEQSPYSPNLNMCDRFLFTKLQENCRMQHYISTEELKNGLATVFDAAYEIFVFKKVREAKKALRRYGSIVRSLYYTIVCFILVVQAYFCFNIVGKYL